MDLITYAFIKPVGIKKVYSLYLEGFSTEEIFLKLNQKWSMKEIDNIIDCTNYLYV